MSEDTGTDKETPPEDEAASEEAAAATADTPPDGEPLAPLEEPPTDTFTREENDLNALLDGFVDALKAHDPGLDGLEAPAEEKKIKAAEDQLGIELGPSYRRFLSRWNGGSAYDTSLYGVGCQEGFDLALLNLRGREEGLPAHLVGFAATITGDVYCFDTSQADELGEHPVNLIDIEEGVVIPACLNFIEFLDRLPTLEAELAQARGPQPMTVEEWEAFLIREREKLRRLSKTPARELTMPDPEKVRGDLGGKIPVDPRHLKPK